MQAHGHQGPGSKSVRVPLCPPPLHHPCSCHQSGFCSQGRAYSGRSVAFPERLLSLSKRIWDLSNFFTRADGLGFSFAPGTEGPLSSTHPLKTFACLRFLVVVTRALRTSACGFISLASVPRCATAWDRTGSLCENLPHRFPGWRLAFPAQRPQEGVFAGGPAT